MLFIAKGYCCVKQKPTDHQKLSKIVCVFNRQDQPLPIKRKGGSCVLLSEPQTC